eukprot:s1941_g4.t1
MLKISPVWERGPLREGVREKQIQRCQSSQQRAKPGRRLEETKEKEALAAKEEAEEVPDYSPDRSLEHAEEAEESQSRKEKKVRPRESEEKERARSSGVHRPRRRSRSPRSRDRRRRREEARRGDSRDRSPKGKEKKRRSQEGSARGEQRPPLPKRSPLRPRSPGPPPAHAAGRGRWVGPISRRINTEVRRVGRCLKGAGLAPKARARAEVRFRRGDFLGAGVFAPKRGVRLFAAVVEEDSWGGKNISEALKWTGMCTKEEKEEDVLRKLRKKTREREEEADGRRRKSPVKKGEDSSSDIQAEKEDRKKRMERKKKKGDLRKLRELTRERERKRRMGGEESLR